MSETAASLPSGQIHGSLFLAWMQRVDVFDTSPFARSTMFMTMVSLHQSVMQRVHVHGAEDKLTYYVHEKKSINEARSEPQFNAG